MLCEFAHNFPIHLANLLDADRHLKRNFREETATDLLTAGMLALNGMGVTVELPDEITTGADMDWVYASPHDVGGGTYLRLVIQAKRAKFSKTKNGGYWYYQHLDHGNPPGQQAQTLVTYATSSPDKMATLPLYFFYHPSSLIHGAHQYGPRVEGVNVVFADKVAATVNGGCQRTQKKVDHWRDDFFSLRELLCWPVAPPPGPEAPIEHGFAPPPPAAPQDQNRTEFLSDGASIPSAFPLPLWHPDFVADRLNALLTERDSQLDLPKDTVREIKPTSNVSASIQRAARGESTPEDRKKLVRPRVILRTNMTRNNPSFRGDRDALRVRPIRQG